ncbi:MAG: AAA family ATPase [Pseudomonadota bacterium]
MLFMVQGFLAAGKSTLSRHLSELSGAAHLDADAYCLETFSSHELIDWNSCFAAAVADLWKQAEGLILDRKSAILDYGFWTRASHDDARAEATRLSVSLVHVFVQAPDETLLWRMEHRKGAVAESNVAAFHRLKLGFQPPEPDEEAIVISTCDGRSRH